MFYAPEYININHLRLAKKLNVCLKLSGCELESRCIHLT